MPPEIFATSALVSSCQFLADHTPKIFVYRALISSLWASTAAGSLFMLPVTCEVSGCTSDVSDYHQRERASPMELRFALRIIEAQGGEIRW